MRFAWLLLADGTGPRPDGKLDIYGAGIDVIWASATPAIHPRISLVARALLTADEAEREHEFSLVLRSPDGVMLANANGRIPAIPDEQRRMLAYGPIGVGMAMDFVNLGLPVFGRYSLEMSLDGTPVPDLPGFNVVPASALQAPAPET